MAANVMVESERINQRGTEKKPFLKKAFQQKF